MTTNTKKRGVARTIIFKSGRLFKAVCLDFDIIEEAKTSEEVEKQVREAVVGYIKNICKNDLDDSLLNRHAEKRYWDIYYKHIKLISSKKEIAPKMNDKSVDLTSMFTIPINLRAFCNS
ncbi:MAG: hypothetical protein ABIG60_05870 [Patescibacteria group bacterium]